MKKNKKPRFEGYDLVDMSDVVTFGTNLYMRKDNLALKIVFPAGQIATFAPLDETDVDNSV